ncbi:MAG: hypothetical protein J3Q66DRAFT_390172 [Benniella sp.]|nr:MAG: hypothetical protein J3Q66DRAFT_390172 [Benniella sp.]
MATPKPPFIPKTKVIRCPANLEGHPALVVTQFAPFDDDDAAFEQRLWDLVAPSFLPQTIQPQRPTAADTVVDLSDAHKHTPSRGRIVEEPSGSREQPMEIDSEETRDSSPFQQSREPSASTESTVEMASRDYENDNLYEVDDAQGLQELQDMCIDDREDSNKEFCLHHPLETIIKEDTRQPIPGSSKATGFDRSSALSRSGESSSAAASWRRPRGISDPLVRDNNKYTNKRDSFSTVYSPRASRSSSPVSADRMCLEAAERARSTSKDYGMNVDSHPATPTRADERRLSLSSFSTKSPSSTTRTSTQSVQDLPGWSPSLEMPPRRTGSVKMTRTSSDGTRRSLQGFSPTSSFDGLPETTEVVGWSSSMETPPKAKGTYTYPRVGGPISKDILDVLRGNPRSTSTQNAKYQSALPQDTIGSLWVSLIDEDEYNEQGLESSRKTGIGFTLPNTMVQELEQVSPVLSRSEMPSPIQTISKAAPKRGSKLMHDDDLSGMAPQYQDQAKVSTTTSSLYDPVASNATTAGSTATQRVSGFKTGRGISLMEPSKAARERTAEFFAGYDLKTQTFTGFKTGKGIPLAASKAARERTEDSFAEDDMDDPLIPKTPGHVKAVPFIQPAQSEGFGFSSREGLWSSTKLALANPRSMYARSLELIEPDLSGYRLPSITPPEHQSSSIGVSSAAPQQPVISPHMMKSRIPRLKSLQAATSRSSQSSLMKSKIPLRQAATSGSSQSGLMKSKIPSKSPMKRPLVSTVVGGPSNGKSCTGNNTSAEDVSPSKNSGLDKSHAGKRVLHPNARITSTAIAQPPSVTHIPRYTPLFHLPVQGQRSSLRDTFGCPRPIEREGLLGLGVPNAAIDMTLDDARTYRFETWGPEDAHRDLIARGAVPNRLSNAWLSNHYGLIVWKLACYLRSWPHYFLSQILSWFCPAGVLNQLAYRYEREINLGERPALRRIVEGDETAGRHMVLCIASIAKEFGQSKGVPILAPAGTGATTTSVSIVLQANGTRLAAWDTKLGFQRSPMVWTMQIRSISADGGLVPGLDVLILRKYPVVFVETLKDGVTRIKRTAWEERQAIAANREPFKKQYQDMVQEVEDNFGEGTSRSDVWDEIYARADELEAQVPARNVVPFFTIRVGVYGNNAGFEGRDENGRWQEAQTP